MDIDLDDFVLDDFIDAGSVAEGDGDVIEMEVIWEGVISYDKVTGMGEREKEKLVRITSLIEGECVMMPDEEYAQEQMIHNLALAKKWSMEEENFCRMLLCTNSPLVPTCVSQWRGLRMSFSSQRPDSYQRFFSTSSFCDEAGEIVQVDVPPFVTFDHFPRAMMTGVAYVSETGELVPGPASYKTHSAIIAGVREKIDGEMIINVAVPDRRELSIMIGQSNIYGKHGMAAVFERVNSQLYTVWPYSGDSFRTRPFFVLDSVQFETFKEGMMVLCDGIEYKVKHENTVEVSVCGIGKTPVHDAEGNTVGTVCTNKWLKGIIEVAGLPNGRVVRERPDKSRPQSGTMIRAIASSPTIAVFAALLGRSTMLSGPALCAPMPVIMGRDCEGVRSRGAVAFIAGPLVASKARDASTLTHKDFRAILESHPGGMQFRYLLRHLAVYASTFSLEKLTNLLMRYKCVIRGSMVYPPDGDALPQPLGVAIGSPCEMISYAVRNRTQADQIVVRCMVRDALRWDRRYKSLGVPLSVILVSVDDDRILLTRPIGAPYWDTAAMGMVKWKESHLAALQRETEEECGWSIQPDSGAVGTAHVLSMRLSGPIDGLWGLVLVAVCNCTGDVDTREQREALWVRRKEIKRYKLRHDADLVVSQLCHDGIGNGVHGVRSDVIVFSPLNVPTIQSVDIDS